MANIPVRISRGKKFLNGASPVVPGYIVGDAPDPNQPTNDAGTFLELTDVNAPTGYVGNALKVFRVNSGETELEPFTIPLHNAVTIGTPANGLSINPTTQILTIGLASSGVTGALSGTDWNTFNSKEPAISAGTALQYFRGDKTFQTLNTAVVPESGNLYFTETRVRATVLTGYTVGANTALASSDSILGAFQKVQGQINARVSGTIAAGQVAFGTGVNSIGGENDFWWDAVNNRLGLLTNVPTNTLDVNGTTRIRTIANLGATATEVLVPSATGVVNKRTIAEFKTDLGLTTAITGTGVAGQVAFFNGAGSVTGDTNLTYTTTDSGNKLRVNGTVRIDDIPNAVGNFATWSATGVLQQITSSQALSYLGAASVSHTHTASQITDLAALLSEKASLSHNHDWSQIANKPLFTRSIPGLVPASGGSGTDRFLREDGNWATPSGTGGGGGLINIWHDGNLLPFRVSDGVNDTNQMSAYDTFYRSGFQPANRPTNTNWVNVFSLKFNDSNLVQQLGVIPGNRLTMRYSSNSGTNWGGWVEFISSEEVRKIWVGTLANAPTVGSRSADTIYFIL